MHEMQNLDMPVLTGQRWGQYRILGFVEQGRFSRAYLGEHIQYPSKRLVVEIFPMNLPANDCRTFLQSGHALKLLVHPSILRLFDVGIEHTTPFIVLDFIQHTPLRQLYLRGQGQPLEKLLPYLRQVASALQYAHTNGRVHKHLRPDNVLLGSNGAELAPNKEVFVCDFALDGIDKNELFQNYKRRMLPIEPLTYMAPEQIQQQPVNASDQYALGTMIYEWLCGTPPFLGNPSEIAQQQLYRTPPSLRQKVLGISPDIEEVVMTALAKEPSKRFANVPAFVKALEHAYEAMKPGDQRGIAFSTSIPAISLPVTPLPPTLPPTTSPSQPIIAGPMANPPNTNPSLAFHPSISSAPQPVKQQQKLGNPRRRAFLVSTASVAVIGGVGAWLLWNKLRPAPNLQPDKPDTTPTPVAPSQQVVYHEHSARVNAVAWSPDGKKVASAGDDKLVLICDGAGTTLLTYSGHRDRVNAVAWSPDGKYIASGSADKTAQIWDAISGKLVFTYTRHTGAVNAVAWSADNRFVASGSDDKTVHAWFATTNNVFLTYHGHKAAITSVAWSPNMQKIASGSWDHTLQVCSTVNTDDQAFVVGDQIFAAKIHGDNVVYAVAWSPDGTLIASGGGDSYMKVSMGKDGGDANYDPRRHHKPMRSVVWSPDGKFIASGSDDKIVSVWNATIQRPALGEPYTFTNHSNSVLALAWSPESTFIASGSADTTVQLWKPL